MLLNKFIWHCPTFCLNKVDNNNDEKEDLAKKEEEQEVLLSTWMGCQFYNRVDVWIVWSALFSSSLEKMQKKWPLMDH